MAQLAVRPKLAFLWTASLVGLTFASADTSHVADVGASIFLLMSGLCAGVIIALCLIGGRAERLLVSPVPQFLGRISYSLPHALDRIGNGRPSGWRCLAFASLADNPFYCCRSS